MIVVLIGVLFALFRHIGVVAAFAKRISVESQSPRRIGFTAWGAYITSLILVQKGPVSNAGEAMSVFVHAIPYNFYSILLVVFTLGICLKLIPDFGPVRKAEHRASTTGAVLREGPCP
jgi:hypothetical protein